MRRVVGVLGSVVEARWRVASLDGCFLASSQSARRSQVSRGAGCTKRAVERGRHRHDRNLTTTQTLSCGGTIMCGAVTHRAALGCAGSLAVVLCVVCAVVWCGVVRVMFAGHEAPPLTLACSSLLRLLQRATDRAPLAAAVTSVDSASRQICCCLSACLCTFNKHQQQHCTRESNADSDRADAEDENERSCNM